MVNPPPTADGPQPWYLRLVHWIGAVMGVRKQLQSIEARLTESLLQQAKLVHFLRDVSQTLDPDRRDEFVQRISEMYASMTERAIKRGGYS